MLKIWNTSNCPTIARRVETMSFILKNYQQRILADLEDFLRECRFSNPAAAYVKIAHRKDENGRLKNSYATPEYTTLEGMDNSPHVCLRVPTGGGKTYLAALSLQYAARFMGTEAPTVLWFVPSDAIRRQTVGMLNNPQHPCRKAINEVFGMMTLVCDIEDFASLRPQDFTDRACVIVSTVQMFRVNETAKTPQGRMSKATRKIYATHEALETHFEQFLPPEPSPQLERDERGEIKLSFANLLFLVRPAVILDEAHGFVSELSKTVLQRINPSCVIEWTATPRERLGGEPLHNVLASVGAEELRDEEMVKLPIRVTRHTDWEKAVNGAVNERNDLARLAKESHDPVRPIVLYKAQRKNAEVTVERLKRYLLNEGIAEHSIAIATGETKELIDVDLLAPDCGIEHIITVEALREGWDCSFAYVLCSVDHMHSTTAVEQLLGRVLRMPFAKRRRHEALNRAYAHVPADSIIDAVRIMRERMVTKLGFQEEEIRWSLQGNFPFIGEGAASRAGEGETVLRLTSPLDFSALPDAERETAQAAIAIIPPKADSKEEASGVNVMLTKPVSAAAQTAIANAVAEDAREEARRNIARVNEALMERRSPAEKGVPFAPLPQLSFFLPDEGMSVIASAGSLYEAAEWNDLGADCLIRDFSIREDAETWEITVSIGKVVHKSVDAYQIPIFHDKNLGMDASILIAWLEKEIHKSDRRYFSETLQEFTVKNVQALLATGLTQEQLLRAKYEVAEALKQWLHDHAMRVSEATRKRMLFDNEDLRCNEFEFTFEPDAYMPGEQLYTGVHQFQKHYYPSIGKMDSDEEEECAIALDGLNEVRHWVRNVPRKPNSFALPRLSNLSFYPDFVAELTNEKILVVEYKGADRWKDSKPDRQIGELWERVSDGKNFFLMASKRQGNPSILGQLQKKVGEIFKLAVA